MIVLKFLKKSVFCRDRFYVVIHCVLDDTPGVGIGVLGGRQT